MTPPPDNPTLAVQCPACGSKPGHPCIRWDFGGEPRIRATRHAERMTAARKATK